MTFERWLRKQINRPDPIGDLANDVRQDKCWPMRASLGDLLAHLEGRHSARPRTLGALRQAWREWEAT